MPKYIALIIEDSNIQATVLLNWLRQRDWDGLWAHSIDTAVSSFAGQHAHLMLLDMHLGKHVSLDSVPRLRTLWPATPIAAMTSDATAYLGKAVQLGCEFVLHKPFRQHQLDDLLEDTARVAAGETFRPAVLIVDDSPTVRKIAEALARRGGLRPTLCETMEQTLDRLAWDRIDCVVTDIFMPGMGGIEGIMRIREMSPATAIVAMSAGQPGAMSFEDTLKAAHKIGADRCLAKPFTPEQLSDTVRAAIAARKGHAQRAAAPVLAAV